MQFDVIVIGAGAAGMMCAATAGARGRHVLLIDHAAKLAEKIRISGGGRCNFTNRDLKPDNFLSDNPHFCRSALSRYTPQHFIALVDSHGIAHHEKTLGQLFCDDSSQQIIDMLKAECDSAGVTWQRPSVVLGVTQHDAGGFSVNTDQGEHSRASLVIATGGLTVPKIGATPFGYRVAEQFGLKVVPPRPALVPLALDPAWLARFGELSGASFDSIASCAGPKFREQTLLTHRGLSGPAILQASSYWQQAGGREPVVIDLLPDLHDVEGLAAGGPQRQADTGRTAVRTSAEALRAAMDRCRRRRQMECPHWWNSRVLRSRTLHSASNAGRSSLPAHSATTRPKSRWVAWIPGNSISAPWRRDAYRGCTSSARWWM
jgi:predicted Rossmann fold flavoprotein